LTDYKNPEKLRRIFLEYENNKDNLIPILKAIQNEFGYLSPEFMQEASEYLKIPSSKVYGVASFYALFNLNKKGRNIIQVCRGTACHVRGGSQILQEVVKYLGIQPGETTEDSKYSLETISCFGSCALAPVMVINGKVYGRLTPDKAIRILGKIK
jgi:NADH-quinone oxidoreductase subunit E